MKLINKYCLSVFLLILCILCLTAQVAGKNHIINTQLFDSSKVITRTSPDDIIKNYRNDKDFAYYKRNEESSAINEFFNYLYEYIIKALLVEPIRNPGNIFSIIIFTIFIGGIAFLVIRFAGGSLFARNTRIAGQVNPLSLKEVESEDLETRLSSEKEKKQYRDAVRLLFLIALRNLKKRDLIKWKQDKTNADFSNDIKDAGIKFKFRHLAAVFEYVWYGEFSIDSYAYNTIESRFDDFRKTLGEYNEV